jgi:hypothetical protein
MNNITNVIRVAVNNNFNCTAAEFNQLKDLQAIHPESLFFINSNIKTRNLKKINDYPYKAVITINPDLFVDPKLVQRLYDIASDKIAFIRIKYIPNHPEILELIKEVSKTSNVVVTLQRFNGIANLEKYVPDYRIHYKWSSNRFRLFGDSLKIIETYTQRLPRTYICDRAGLGCGGCRLCSTLTCGKDVQILTLNLAASGICPYNCVDCYAKTLQHFLRSINVPVIKYDWIHMNHKQSGKTAHIRHLKNKVA